MNELEQNSFIGVGVSRRDFVDSSDLKGWMLKINEHGCLDGSLDCPFFNFLDTISANKNIRNESKKLNVFPNPTLKNCTKQFDTQVSGKLKLFNLGGVLVSEYEINNSSTFQLETTDFTPGSYPLVFFEDGNNLIIRSVIIYVKE